MGVKKIISILCVILILLPLVFSLHTYAHSGRTDSNGGHFNHQTGEYHYHHGYSAHQHPNGICPYSTSHGSSGSSGSSGSDKSSDNTWAIIIGAIIGVPIVFVGGPLLWVHLEKKILNRRNKK